MHDNRCKPMIKYSTFYLIILPLSSWVGPWPSSWFLFLTPGWDFLSSSELFVVCWHTVCWYSFCRRPEVPEWWPVVLQAPKNPKHVNNFKLTNTYMQSYFLFDQSRLIYIYSCNFKLTNTCMLSCFLFYQSRLIYNNSCKIHVYALPFLTPLSLERGGGV